MFVFLVLMFVLMFVLMLVLMFVFLVLTWNGSKVLKPTTKSPFVHQVKLEKFYLHRLLKVEVEQGSRFVIIRPSRLRVLKLLLQQDVERAVLVQGARQPKLLGSFLLVLHLTVRNPPRVSVHCYGEALACFVK